MRSQKTNIRLLALLFLLWPLPTIAGDDEGDEGGEVDTDFPAEAETHPVVSSLGNLSPCATEPSTVDLPEALAEVSSDDIILAIQDGSVGRARLAHAIDSVAAIGSADDLSYVLSIAEDASWMYLADAAIDEASPEDVLATQAHIAAEIRAYVLSAWNLRGDLPSDVLLELVWDEDPLPAGRGIALALASEHQAIVDEAIAACAVNDAAVSVEDLCETAG